MKDRTLHILSALIEDFVATASPIASQKLLQMHDFDVSSATVRNEFALLEEVGLIESPHVSSGKIPTQKGYRFFVDQLMEYQDLEPQFQSVFEKYVAEYKLSKSKEILFDALRLISELSGNVAFAVVENDKTLYLGLSNVVRKPEFASAPERIAQVIEVLEGRQRLQQFLSHADIPKGEIKIFIGEENVLEEISSCAMLVSSFENQNAKGFIGILGPMRMRYGFNKALLKNVLEMV